MKTKRIVIKKEFEILKKLKIRSPIIFFPFLLSVMGASVNDVICGRPHLRILISKLIKTTLGTISTTIFLYTKKLDHFTSYNNLSQVFVKRSTLTMKHGWTNWLLVEKQAFNCVVIISEKSSQVATSH